MVNADEIRPGDEVVLNPMIVASIQTQQTPLGPFKDFTLATSYSAKLITVAEGAIRAHWPRKRQFVKGNVVLLTRSIIGGAPRVFHVVRAVDGEWLMLAVLGNEDMRLAVRADECMHSMEIIDLTS